MKRAVIDVGTNSIKCTLAKIDSEGTLIPILDEQVIQRLGQGLPFTGELDEGVMERNCQAIVELVKKVKRRGARQIFIVGTMALREAQNADEFLHLVKRETGMTMHILTGEEEAYYSYVAVYAGLPILKGYRLIFDTGGGSTEFILGKGGKIEDSFSLQIGGVTLSERYFSTDPVREKEYIEALEAIETFLEQRMIQKEMDVLVGMGGTVTTMGAVMKGMVNYDSTIIHGLVLTKTEVDRQIEIYLERSLEERKTIRGLHPKRADVILGGSLIVKMIMELYHQERLIISDWGLRHGLLYKDLIE